MLVLAIMLAFDLFHLYDPFLAFLIYQGAVIVDKPVTVEAALGYVPATHQNSQTDSQVTVETTLVVFSVFSVAMSLSF